MAKKLLPIGIDDMAFYVPKIYLDIKILAEKRDIPYQKLKQGLGLHKMAFADKHEDAATMAAETVLELIERNNLDPNKIGRIYMGTESALDMAKPTATYAVGMVQNRLETTWGSDCFRNCDVLDMTFACIGATDALLNTLDWVASDPENIGIVIASDIAKYELGSTGEYTQGAGAVAMLIKWEPRLMVLNRTVGIGMESVHDFYKPRREKFTETPVFDGQFSNLCFQTRMTEALDNFRAKAIKSKLFKATQYEALSERWARMVFHLPYAFHAQRIYVEQFINERKLKCIWQDDVAKYGFAEPLKADFTDEKTYTKAFYAYQKMVSDSNLYKKFVIEKLEKSQKASSETGNLYTASIFLALMSVLECDYSDNSKLSGKRIGFVAYGSGSKAKVFEGTVQKKWRDVVAHFHVFNKLENRTEITYEQYVALHEGTQIETVSTHQGSYALERIGQEGVTLGARYYFVL
jgi:hydroxymethylglutaryl-CoA synthase